MKAILNKLINHERLSRDEARQVMLDIADGKFNDCQLSAFMMSFLLRSITTSELAGFRDAIVERRVAIDVDASDAIDIVGTGGDGKNTFNVSTAASFVVAGAGYKVVKHGNYAATSVSGASNVIEYLGAKFTRDGDVVRRALDSCGFAYLHAPFFSPALKSVAAARKAIGVRTFFNILGPLVNPVRPANQLLGVFNLPTMRLYNYIAQEDGRNTSVVFSLDGYDEISLTSPFKVANAAGEEVYTPEQLGFRRIAQSEIYGGNTIDEAAAIFTAVLSGTATEAQTDCVVANAAFAIATLRPDLAIADAIAEARQSINSGKALATLKKFIEIYQ